MRAWLWSTFIVLAGCGAATQECRTYDRTECVQTGGPGEAAVAVVANTAVWASGHGCQMSGCTPPLRCDDHSGLCVDTRCSGEHDDCPNGYACNTERGRCE